MLRILGFLLLAISFNVTTPFNDTLMTGEIQTDSSKILTSLYKDVKILPGKTFSGFSYNVSYNAHTRQVTIRSGKNVEGTSIEYFIDFKLKGKDFDRNTFVPSDDTQFEYLNSFFKINGDSIGLGKTLRNSPAEMIGPSLLWYGDEFGFSGRCYKFKGKEVLLLRGLDLYCNGHHCSAYQLYAIEKDERKYKVEVFKSRSAYPYDFENTFLFDRHADGKPEIYLPINDNVSSPKDFQIYTLFN